jgi:hypothetical protein
MTDASSSSLNSLWGMVPIISSSCAWDRMMWQTSSYGFSENELIPSPKYSTAQRNPQLWYGAGLECWCQGPFSTNLRRQFCAQNRNKIYKTGVLAALRHINSDTQSWWLLPLVSTFFRVCPMFGQAHAISRAMGHGCMLQYSILRRTQIWPMKIWLWHYHQQEGVHGETQFTSPRPIVVIIQSWHGQRFMSTTSFLGKYAHCNSDFILHVSETSQSIYFCDRSWSHYI